MDFEPALTHEIDNELTRLSGMEVGTDVYKTTVDGLTKLMDRAIEIRKVDIAKKEKEKSQEFENKLKKMQVEFEKYIKQAELDCKLEQVKDDKNEKKLQRIDEQKDRLFRNGIAIMGIVIPALITIWGTRKSFEFEKEGTITTIMGRGFINKLLPKK